jgi:hypothetical protein
MVLVLLVQADQADHRLSEPNYAGGVPKFLAVR